jgi:hypothetical protein
MPFGMLSIVFMEMASFQYEGQLKILDLNRMSCNLLVLRELLSMAEVHGNPTHAPKSEMALARFWHHVSMAEIEKKESRPGLD